jgi:SNF2 family DNA or RNA helicase
MTVRVERHGEQRIRATVPWMNGEGSKLAKQVPGCAPMWDRGAGPGGKDKFLGWSYPLDLETCREMRRVFGRELSIGPKLLEWAKAETETERRMLALRSGDGADPGVLSGVALRAPLLAAALRPYQWRGVAFGVQGRSVLIADQCGLGKSLETLGVLAEVDARTVIVFARKSALNSVWRDEAQRWLGDGCRVFVATGTHAEREKAIGHFSTSQSIMPHVMHILVCNIEMARAKKLCPGMPTGPGRFAPRTEGLPPAQCEKEHIHEGSVRHHMVPEWPLLHMMDYDAIVVDESHRALVGKSARSKNVTQVRMGMTLLKLRENGIKISLSGTPWRGKVYNTWGQLNWIRPDVFTSFWRFIKMYFHYTEDPAGYGGIEIGELREDRAEDFHRMMGSYMLRRTKAECAPDLPAKLYAGTPLDPYDPDSPHGVWLDMEPEQARAYAKMDKEAEAEIEGGTLTAVGVLAEITRKKQFASAYMRKVDGGVKPTQPSNKLNWVIDFLESREGNDGKVIIFSQFTELVNMFCEVLDAAYPRQVGRITGETNQASRDYQQKQFQNPSGPVWIMLLNTLAGGESITLDQADDVIFLDETSIPDEQEQAEDRAHRVSRAMKGNQRPVTVYYLRSRGTIEEDICRVTGAREGSVKQALDGSRGVEIMKQIRELHS